uniref:ASCH domain-containing protein n=1 Tax=Stomatohabitans albus TaxID=3110766 RepID=UPI00300D1DFF
MSKLLMSIKPQYVKEIFLGNKKYEFRKRLSYQKCSKIIIYSTSPDKRIVGEVNVIETLEMAPSILWERTKDEAGISADKFQEYFKDVEKA